MTMTAEEALKKRQELVHRMFSSEGEEFFRIVRENCRPGTLAISAELQEQMRGRKYQWKGYTWWKFGQDEAPAGKTRKVLYLHGGGWVMDSGVSQYLFARYLMEQLGCEVWFPEYPLIPEADGLLALEMVYEIYQEMLEECSGDQIAVGGDSAGGALALSLLQHAREKGLALPNTLFLISPAFLDPVRDRSRQEQKYDAYTAQKDTILSLRAFPTVLRCWKGEAEESDYRINPIRGRLKGLPTTLVFCGGDECLEAGNRAFAEKAIMEDVDIRYYLRNQKKHIYVLSDPSAENERQLIVKQLLAPQ